MPLDALLCKDSGCQKHNEELEVYYNDIVQSLDATAAECVLSVKSRVHKFWWTPELDELKQQCIDISTLWASIGRPRSGCINQERLRCKYQYKQAIKSAMQDIDRHFNDNLYEKLCKKDEVSFWRAWRKRFCGNSLKPTNTLNSKTGTDNVLFEFTEYYKGVAQPHNANKNANIASEVDLLMTADNIIMNYLGYQVTAEDVDKCISKMKLHKAAYLDNITSEHLRYGGPHLAVHLCLLFTSMMHHCFVPSEFCKGIILPLLKNKHGDATDINIDVQNISLYTC